MDILTLNIPFTPTASAAQVFTNRDFVRANTPDDAPLKLTKADKAWVKENQNQAQLTSPPPSLSAQRFITSRLDRYAFNLPTSQSQWQNFCLSKYLELIEDPSLDPKVVKSALDSLAKTSVVGLMVDKKEISITSKSTEDIEKELREALDKYLGKPINGEAVRVV